MNITVDIDVQELLWEMRKYDKKEMLEALLSDMDEKDIKDSIKSLDDETIVSIFKIKNIGYQNPAEEKFNQNLISLLGKSWRLSNEEESLINKIAERYS
jgi:hypothetical protein